MGLSSIVVNRASPADESTSLLTAHSPSSRSSERGLHGLSLSWHVDEARLLALSSARHGQPAKHLAAPVVAN